MSLDAHPTRADVWLWLGLGGAPANEQPTKKQSGQMAVASKELSLMPLPHVATLLYTVPGCQPASRLWEGQSLTWQALRARGNLSASDTHVKSTRMSLQSDRRMRNSATSENAERRHA